MSQDESATLPIALRIWVMKAQDEMALFARERMAEMRDCPERFVGRERLTKAEWDAQYAEWRRARLDVPEQGV